MSKYRSQLDIDKDDLIIGLNADTCLTFAWLEDTLHPSINLMALKSLIYDIQTDILQFELNKGKTEHTQKSLDRANQMIELIEKLDKIANQNNTAQLFVRHSYLKMAELTKENERLKDELNKINLAWNQTET